MEPRLASMFEVLILEFSFGGPKNHFMKVLFKKMHCCDEKSSCLAKDLVFLMNVLSQRFP
jgi:hypothetical protein